MSVTAGNATIVNSYYTGDQLYSELVGLSDGGWVVVWSSPERSAFYQQRYASDGSKVGGEVRVNTLDTFFQTDKPATITALGDGGWVVTWNSLSADGDGWAIHEQRYSSAGTAVGGEIQVNTHTTGHQYNPVVTGLADGGWVVTWHSEGQDGSDLGVYQQRYNANGTTRGGEIQVNTYFFGAQGYPSTTALADGGWVVTWVNAAQDGGGVGIYQQVYSSFGTAVGGEVQVSATGMFDAFNHSYVSALEDGGWIVAWTDMSASNQREIVFQRYDSVGEEVGERTVAVLGANGVAGLNGVSEASVTGLKDGGWVVTWYADAGDTATGAVYQQLYNADGTASGDAFKMNADSAHGYGSVTALDDGGWVVTWTEMGVDQSGSAVMQRVFHRDLNVAPTGTDNTVLGALEDHGYVFSVDDFGFFDTNGDRFTAVVITTLPSQGVLTFNGDAVSKGDVIPVSKIELLVWTPPANGHGAGMGSFTFQVMDDAGNANGGVNVDPTPRTAAFSVASVNDAPSGADNTNIVVEQNGSHQFAASDFGFTDVVDGNNFLAVVIATLPSSGSLKLNGTAVTVNQVIAVSDLSHLVWTPATGATGNDIGGFTFKVRDDGGVALGGVNTDPTAHVIKFDVEKANADPTLDHPLGDVVASQGSDFQLPVPSNTFSDADGDALSYTAKLLDGADLPDWLTFNTSTRTFSGTPAADDIGSFTVVITVSDGKGGFASDTFAITVKEANHAPTGNPTFDLDHGTEDTGYTLGYDMLVGGFTDADGDTLTATNLVASDGATIENNGNGTFTVHPAKDFHGVVTVSYVVDDGNGGTLPYTVDITFDPVNDAPTGSPSAVLIHGTEDKAYSVSAANLLAGFSDADGDTLQVAGLVASDGAKVVDNHDGTFSITPADDFNGTVTLTYKVQDGNGGSKNATQSVVFDAANDAPTLVGSIDVQSAKVGEEYTLPVPEGLFHDVDQGDVLTLSASLSDGAELPLWLEFDPTTGIFSGTPSDDDVATLHIKVTAADKAGAQASETFDLTIDTGNSAPEDITLDNNTVRENAKAGTLIGNVEAIDPEGDEVTYDLIDDAGGNFVLDQGQLLVAQGANIDFETHHTYTVTVRATDALGAFSDQEFEIDVTDVKDVPAPGDDVVDGDGDDNELFGLAGRDELNGLGGNDILDGGAGADDLDGGKGEDAASYADAKAGVHASLTRPATNTGDAKGDSYTLIEDLTGSQFNDKLIGNSKDNVFISGRGNDVMTGGSGSDTFVFSSGDGRDSITDFDSGNDAIDLEGAHGIRSFKDMVKNHLQVSGDDVVISTDTGDQLRLFDMEKGDIQKSDFIF